MLDSSNAGQEGGLRHHPRPPAQPCGTFGAEADFCFCATQHLLLPVCLPFPQQKEKFHSKNWKYL